MANSKMSLPLDIWYDIQRHIFIYLLLIMVVVSAFSVIYFTHLNRQTTSGLEVLLTERDELDIETLRRRQPDFWYILVYSCKPVNVFSL